MTLTNPGWIMAALLMVVLAMAGMLALLDRRRHKEARKSDKQYRLLFDANPLPMWVYDEATLRFLAVNTAAVQAYGYTREEFLGMTIRDIRPAEDVPRLMEHLADAPGELHGAGIWRHRTEDGSIILVEITGQPLVFDGRAACLIGAADVTARVRSEQEIKRQRDRLQVQAELINQSNDAIIGCSAEGVIAGWNGGAEKLYGWTPSEAVGRQLTELLQTDPETAGEIGGALREQGKWEGELAQSRRDGRRLTVDSRQVVLRDTAGGLTGVLAINRDITDRRYLEEQLRQSQKLESVGQLAGGVAHDFNNLMTIVSGYANMVLEDLPEGDPLRESLGEISLAATRATALTRQLLTFSRRQARRASDFDLNHVVRDLEKLLRRWIGEDIVLILALDSHPTVVHADRSHIEQVILNLVINARAAMPNGGNVTVETARVDVDVAWASTHIALSSGKYVELRVSDTGHGMSAEVQARCFEPFFTTKEPGRGTGLGLSTVYGIVKQSEGSIFVQSEPGVGTSFHVYLPAVDRMAGQVEAARPAAALGGHETILVVEDEEGVRKYVQEALERKGYRVLTAANGREALEITRSTAETIDLLLTDMVMPEMGGVELAEAFHQLRPSVPVLHMSGYSDRLWQGEVPQHYLQKPFTPDALLQSIRTLLERGRTATA
jgi:PAS domain S-box-containing protein